MLNQLNPKLNKSGLNDNLEKRAEKVLLNAKTLDVKSALEKEDLLAAKENLNLLFTYDIFSRIAGLEITHLSEQEKVEAAGLTKDTDVDDSREERCISLYI